MSWKLRLRFLLPSLAYESQPKHEAIILFQRSISEDYVNRLHAIVERFCTTMPVSTEQYH